jgi:hypothetical protein
MERLDRHLVSGESRGSPTYKSRVTCSRSGLAPSGSTLRPFSLSLRAAGEMTLRGIHGLLRDNPPYQMHGPKHARRKPGNVMDKTMFAP